MLYKLYKTASSILKPLVISHLETREKEGKEDPKRITERYGKTNLKRPKGPLIWFHAASVGESLSILALIDQLLKLHESFQVLVTTGTITSAQLMQQRLPARCIHQYCPFDVIVWVRAFLDHWKPDLALWVESEFWPNLLCETHARQIPMVLLNGSVSDKSFKTWKYVKSIISKFLNCYDLCIAQSKSDQSKLKDLGAEKVLTFGNLKFASSPLEANSLDFEALKSQIGERPIWVCASTHPGEEEIICKAHKEIKKTFSNLLTILVPRHPKRGLTLNAFCEQEGIKVALRTEAQTITDDMEMYIGNTIGELGLFYKLSKIAFVGGSLVPVGGHNLIEPAQLDCALLHGPHMSDQQEMRDLFQDQEAALEVSNETELAETVVSLLSDPKRLETMTLSARHVADSQAKVIDSILREILPYLRSLVENDHQRTSFLV